MRVRKNDLKDVIEKYSSTLYKICYLILKDEYDTKDVLQETFLAYYSKSPDFESEEHKKAWLIKVSQNKCREFLRFHKRHACLSLDDMEEKLKITHGMRVEEQEILEMVWGLEYKLKSVVLLHYIEGYSVEETAGILRISVSAAKKRLQRARERLRTEFGGEPAYEK